MSKRDELIVKYAADLKDKCGMKPDMDLLTKVTIGCGPSIYNADAATVSGSDASELAILEPAGRIAPLPEIEICPVPSDEIVAPPILIVLPDKYSS